MTSKANGKAEPDGTLNSTRTAAWLSVYKVSCESVKMRKVERPKKAEGLCREAEGRKSVTEGSKTARKLSRGLESKGLEG